MKPFFFLRHCLIRQAYLTISYRSFYSTFLQLSVLFCRTVSAFSGSSSRRAWSISNRKYVAGVQETRVSGCDSQSILRRESCQRCLAAYIARTETCQWLLYSAASFLRRFSERRAPNRFRFHGQFHGNYIASQTRQKWRTCSLQIFISPIDLVFR